MAKQVEAHIRRNCDKRLIEGDCMEFSKSTRGKTGEAIFATYAGDDGELYSTLILAESIREYGESFRSAPIWIYVPEDLTCSDTAVIAQFVELQVEIRRSRVPAEAERFFYAARVFAAARAEAAAETVAAILIWMAEDTVVLAEPAAFRLPEGVACGYRPVMHNIIGSAYAQPPDVFWQRLYDLMHVPADALFSMTTLADRQVIRAYFNAGLVVVRPKRGILRAWAKQFQTLYGDAEVVRATERDVVKKVFLHQMALVGAIVGPLARSEMLELPASYNYPMFFKEMFGAAEAFDSLADVVTMRYDVYFRNPAPDWHLRLKGPVDRIAWLKARLGRG